MALSSTICSPIPSVKAPQFSFKLSSLNLISTPIRSHVIPFRSPPIRIQSLKPEYTRNLLGFCRKQSGFLLGRKVGFRASAENGDGESKSAVDEAEEEARGQSTMPERFRYLTKEAPDLPVRWPLLIVLPFLIYAWRTVLWELSNWKKAVVGIVHFVGYLLKLALAFIFHFIGGPITSLIRGVEITIYTIQDFCSAVIAYVPFRELTLIILLASAVFAIAEESVPDSVHSQPYILAVAGLIGFAAVRSFISEIFFWMLLLGLFSFARFIKKRDYVSSALPVAAVLAAIGEPWVRVVVIVSYLVLAITHSSKKLPEGKGKGEAAATGRKFPIPVICTAYVLLLSGLGIAI